MYDDVWLVGWIESTLHERGKEETYDMFYCPRMKWLLLNIFKKSNLGSAIEQHCYFPSFLSRKLILYIFFYFTIKFKTTPLCQNLFFLEFPQEWFTEEYQLFGKSCHESSWVNPIPTGTELNQSIYSYHVTQAGRNRVKSHNLLSDFLVKTS